MTRKRTVAVDPDDMRDILLRVNAQLRRIDSVLLHAGLAGQRPPASIYAELGGLIDAARTATYGSGPRVNPLTGLRWDE